MKFCKYILCVSFAAVLLLGLSGLSSAQMYGPGMMGGYGWGGGGDTGISQEKFAAMQKLYNEHYQATAQLRQQLFAKHSELNAQLYSGKTDDKRVETLTKEIADLNAKLFADQVNLRKQLVKQGLPVGGMGNGGMGYGGGGYGGMMNGGYGGGGGWGGMGYGGMMNGGY
ncbi:MAG: hypothetical protein CVU73_08275 [Deltaproteobacteria bacterium HGW-Deltaproteobacteria-8]|jgi:zinc resistance-associated protein|nr:MAG: hypothetical protein CVU73_08275 [Deltaproteobacteria bacterium HGW-Deltaproteobacteria-8]